MLGNISKNLFKSMNINNKLFTTFKTTNIFRMNNSFVKQQKYLSSHYVNHRNTIDNNEETPFDFTDENYKKIDEILVNII
jgi:hypothetical protein